MGSNSAASSSVAILQVAPGQALHFKSNLNSNSIPIPNGNSNVLSASTSPTRSPPRKRKSRPSDSASASRTESESEDGSDTPRRRDRNADSANKKKQKVENERDSVKSMTNGIHEHEHTSSGTRSPLSAKAKGTPDKISDISTSSMSTTSKSKSKQPCMSPSLSNTNTPQKPRPRAHADDLDLDADLDADADADADAEPEADADGDADIDQSRTSAEHDDADDYAKGIIACDKCGKRITFRDKSGGFTLQLWDDHKAQCHAHPSSPTSLRPSIPPTIPTPSTHQDPLAYPSSTHPHPHSHPHPTMSPTLDPNNPNKKRRAKRTEAERIEYLRLDPYVAQFEAYRVLCGSCNRWIRLRPNSTYCSIPWDAHRRSCLSKNRGSKPSNVSSTPSQNPYPQAAYPHPQQSPRLPPHTVPSSNPNPNPNPGEAYILESDSYVKKLEVDAERASASVLCAGCDEWVDVGKPQSRSREGSEDGEDEGRRRSVDVGVDVDVGKWLAHRERCLKSERGSRSPGMMRQQPPHIHTHATPNGTAGMAAAHPSLQHYSPRQTHQSQSHQHQPQTLSPHSPHSVVRSSPTSTYSTFASHPSSSSTSTSHTSMHSSSANSGSASDTRRRSAEQRLHFLLSDPYLQTVEPNRVFCKLCQKWVQLRQDSTYCAYPWLQHKTKCLVRMERKEDRIRQKQEQQLEQSQARRRRHHSVEDEDDEEDDVTPTRVFDANEESEENGDVDMDDENINEEEQDAGNEVADVNEEDDKNKYREHVFVTRLNPPSAPVMKRRISVPSSTMAAAHEQRHGYSVLRTTHAGHDVPSQSQSVARHASDSHHMRGPSVHSMTAPGTSSVSGRKYEWVFDGQGGPSNAGSIGKSRPYPETQGVPSQHPHPSHRLSSRSDRHRHSLSSREQGERRSSHGHARSSQSVSPHMPTITASVLPGVAVGAIRNKRSPITRLADLDSPEGRQSFISHALHYLFSTTYESTDELSFSGLLTYLNAAMPLDKHEDFDLIEIKNVLKGLEGRGEVEVYKLHGDGGEEGGEGVRLVM